MTNTNPDTLERLTHIVRAVLDDDSLVLTPHTTAADHPGWDSLAQITILVEVEQAFAIKIRTVEIESLHNVGDLIELISQKQR